MHRLFITTIFSLVQFVIFSQSFSSYKELKAISGLTLIEAKNALVSKGLTESEVLFGESISVSFHDSKFTKAIEYVLDGNLVYYATLEREEFLKVSESVSSAKGMKEQTKEEKNALGLIESITVFLGDGGYFYSYQEKKGSSIIYYLMWIPTDKIKKDEPKSTKTKKEDKIHTPHDALDYVVISVGGVLPNSQATLSPHSSTPISNYYKSNGRIGANVIGLNGSIGGLVSPDFINSSFPSFLDLSLRFGFNYYGMPISTSRTDFTGKEFEKGWYGSASAGVGPAISFSDENNKFAAAIYYMPQVNVNFGGRFSTDYKGSGEILERDSKRFSYRGTVGLDIKIDAFYLGFEYSMFKDHSIWKYTVPQMNPVRVGSSYSISQFVFKIGVVIGD